MSDTLFGGIIELSVDGQPIVPNIILGYRSGEKIGVIQNVTSFVDSNHLMSAPEISFDVYKMMDGVECNYWDDIRDFKLVYIPHLGHDRFNPWYEIAVTLDENDETVKHINGVHIQEAELSQLSLHDIQINTEDDIVRDDYTPSIIYNPNNPDASILDRLLSDKATHYSVRYVAPSIAKLQRTFEFDNTTIYDAFMEIAEEIEGIFIFGESTNDDGQIHRTISLYDLNDVCQECGERGTFTDGVCSNCGSSLITYGYGDDSGIFVNKENFAENINYASNHDELKNCFRLEAGDDLMTATVRNINPNGSQYIWYLNNDVRAEMSESLRNRVESYDELNRQYQSTIQMDVPSSAVSEYNNLVNKYKSLDSTFVTVDYPIIGYSKMTELYYLALNLYSALKTTLAPTSAKGHKSTAAQEAAKLTTGTLSPIGVQNVRTASESTVNSAVLSYAKTYIDTSVYKISIVSSTYSNNVWRGKLNVTSYIDDSDTADTSSLTISVTDASAEYMRCLVQKAMKKSSEDATGTIALFKMSESDFKTELSKYSVDNLNILASVSRACLDVMISHEVATPGSESWGNMYQSMYVPYYNKNEWIQEELLERENEVKVLRNPEEGTGLLDIIEKCRQKIADVLNLREYLGETLWAEFCSFRRDDTYQNENFISDGLDDYELIQNAREFLEYAQKEIIKAGTLQHTINCNLYNLLLVDQKEVESDDSPICTYDGLKIVTENGIYLVKSDTPFSGLTYKFKLGNWLYLEADGNIYRLRMTDYSISYDNLMTIEVDFSDVTYRGNDISDINNLLTRTASMITSYPSTSRQANKGSRANQLIINMVANGLDLTNKKIVSNATHQNLVVDDTGLLMRAQNEFDDDYNAEQVKIINHGLYYTNDNWRTVQTGIGKFIYYDPDDGQYKEDYGLIAHKIVGNIILGNELGIYNESGSVKLDENGVVITSNPTDDNPAVFTIQRDDGEGNVTKFMYIDENGNLKITGNSVEIEHTSAEEYLMGQVDTKIQTSARGIMTQVSESYADKNSVNTLTQTAEDLTVLITQGGTLTKDGVTSSTMTRMYNGGVLVGKALPSGTSICALVNAEGSFDIVSVTWDNYVPTISGTALASFGNNVHKIGNETIATKSDIDNIDFQTSNRNLCVGTSLSTATISSASSSSVTQFYPYSNYGLDLIQHSAVGADVTLSFDWEKTGSSTMGYFVPELSESTAEGAISPIQYFSSGTVSGHYSRTLQLTQSQISMTGISRKGVRVRLYETSGSGSATITISNLKLEMYDVETGWNVAPEEGAIQHCVCYSSSSTTGKIASAQEFYLYPGAIAHVYFENENTKADATLNINNSGAKPIYVNGTAITSGFCPWNDGETVTFSYDGTHWNVVGQMNLTADNIKAGTLNAVQVNAASGSNLGGWTVNTARDDAESSLRSPWTTMNAGTSNSYQYQTALKATANDNYGVIFVKNRKNSSSAETYPFAVYPNGSAFSKNPTWRWHWGYDGNTYYDSRYVELRQAGTSTHSISLARFDEYSGTDASKYYPLIHTDGKMASSVGFTVNVSGSSIVENRSFTFGSMVFLTFRIQGITLEKGTVLDVVRINNSSYYPTSDFTHLIGAYVAGTSPRMVMARAKSSGYIDMLTEAETITNGTFTIVGFYSLE